MPAISARKTMNVVRLYMKGHPHQYIADRAGVSKGTVANIIDDLREGRFNAIENLSDQIDGLREVAVELRKSGLSLSQAAMGLSASRELSHWVWHRPMSRTSLKNAGS